MALVLCTGVEPALLRTRQLILQKAGHEVITAIDERELLAACQQRTFDVVVIGQTVTSKLKHRIVSLVRQHCSSAKILELYQFSTGRLLENADSWLGVPVGVPQELAERVTALAAKRENNHPDAEP